MMKFIIALLFIYVFELLDAELVQVHVVFRHGDRAPVKIYPNDNNKQNTWKNGIGQLTEFGIRQHFGLGKWLWRRYYDFLGSEFNNSLIYIRSTNVDRTLMSAESNLAGLFYNVSGNIINNFKWRPVPVHTVSKENDLILLESDDCPNYKPLRDKLMNEEPFKSILEKYKDVLEILKLKSGVKNMQWSNFWMVYDSIFCEKTHNLTVNSWVTPALWKRMKEINNILWKLDTRGKLPKMGAGVLLKVIVDHMSSVFNHKEKSEKSTLPSPSTRYFVYSGHDTDVAPLASLLLGDYGEMSSWQPPYASAVLVELHKNPWRVKVIYKNYTESDGENALALKPRLIVGCKAIACPYKEFIEAVKSKMVSKAEFESLCFKSTINKVLVIQIMFICSIVIILLLIIVIMIQNYKRSKKWKSYKEMDDSHYEIN